MFFWMGIVSRNHLNVHITHVGLTFLLLVAVWWSAGGAGPRCPGQQVGTDAGSEAGSRVPAVLGTCPGA